MSGPFMISVPGWSPFCSQTDLARIIHENAQFSLAPFAHRKFRSVENTVRIPLLRKYPCEQKVHRDNRTFHE